MRGGARPQHRCVIMYEVRGQSVPENYGAMKRPPTGAVLCLFARYFPPDKKAGALAVGDFRGEKRVRVTFISLCGQN